MRSLRFAFFVLGLILLAVSIVNFIYLQVGAGSEFSREYRSAPTATPPPPTPTNAAGVPARTPVPSATLALIGTPEESPVVITPTPVPSATPAPIGTPVPLVSPTHTPPVESQLKLRFRGTPIALLGTHVVQRREYLFCIGRAYGVLPQAIAEVNFLALDAPLFIGQQLQIPDVPWVNIPPGRICTPQLKSPYSPASVSMNTIPPSLVLGSRAAPGGPWWGEDGSISGELRLINFVIPKERVKKVDSQSVSLAVTPTPVLTEETRRVRAEWPDRIFLGASEVVKLTFYPDPTSQAGESGATSSGQTNATATNTPEPHELITNSQPLVIPDVFDNCYVFATARLDAVGFSYSPIEDAMQPVNKGEPVTWHWSIKPQDAGQQKLIISLRLHFEQKPNIEAKCNNGRSPRDGQIWAESFPVDVQKPWFDLYTGYVTTVLGIISVLLSIGAGIMPKT